MVHFASFKTKRSWSSECRQRVLHFDNPVAILAQIGFCLSRVTSSLAEQPAVQLARHGEQVRGPLRYSQGISRGLEGLHTRSVARAALSWKVRYRTILWFFSQMSKLYGARSLLYRRQILQVNIRWKALDEIYKIYMLLHRSDLNISAKIRQFVFGVFNCRNARTFASCSDFVAIFASGVIYKIYMLLHRSEHKFIQNWKFVYFCY